MDIPDIPEELRRKIIRLAAEDDLQEDEDSWLEEEYSKPETVIIVLLVLNEN